MEENNNEKDKFVIILFVLFIMFLIIYLTNESGLYQYKAHNKAVLTEQNIKKFEKDIEDGKNVTLNDYVISDNVDYSNTISDLGYNIGKYTSNFLNKGIKKTLKVLSALFFE